MEYPGNYCGIYNDGMTVKGADMKALLIVITALLLTACEPETSTSTVVTTDQGNPAVGSAAAIPAPERCEVGTGFRLPGGGWCSCSSRLSGLC